MMQLIIRIPPAATKHVHRSFGKVKHNLGIIEFVTVTSFFQGRLSFPLIGVVLMVVTASATIANVVEVLLEDESVEANKTENATSTIVRDAIITDAKETVQETVQELPNTFMQASLIPVKHSSTKATQGHYKNNGPRLNLW